MTFSREDMAAACRKWGGFLWLPAEIDGRQLLWALSGNESSFGANATPRHEPAYDVGGIYAKNPQQAKLLEAFGSAAACSYGPWQLMLVNCHVGVTPDDMARLDRCALETVGFINKRILYGQHAQGISQIAAAYNSGRTFDMQQIPAGVERYVEECAKNYAVPMPALAVA